MRNLFILAFLAWAPLLMAQKILITGQVIDDDTEEGVPFCSVFIPGDIPMGVTSDVEGKYRIEMELANLPSDTIMAASVGYDNLMKRIDKTQTELSINFRLKSSSVELETVMVLAGENPANEVVRRIVANKERNKRKNFDNYQVECYSKTELDLNNIDPKMKDSPLFKDLQFIFENIDSTSDVKPFLPAYVAERIYDVFYVNGKGKKELLKAQKVSGVENSTVVDFIGQMHDEFDLYDNYITVLGKEFISPFANNGLFFYEYYIIDSTHIEDEWSYKLKFKPKRRGENTFYGDFWVSVENYGLEIVNMRMSEDVNVNLVNRLLIYAEYKQQDSIWLPYKEKTVIDFALSKKREKMMGVIGRKTLMYKDFQIGQEELEKTYKEADPEDIDYIALEKADSFWSEQRHEKLTDNEKSVYKMVDSIKTVPIYQTAAKLLSTISTGFLEVGPVYLGPYGSIFNYNDIEGIRLGFGLGTGPQFSKKLRLYGYGAYGFGDKRWKYRLEGQYVFNRFKRREVGVKYINDLLFDNRNSEQTPSQGLFAGFLRRDVPAKMLAVKEFKAYYQHTYKRGFSNRLAVIHRNMIPQGAIFSRSDQGFNFRYYPDANDYTKIDTAVTTTEILLKFRYAYKEKLLRGYFSDLSIGTKFPIIELSYLAGIKGVLGSKYNYHRISAEISHWFNVGPLGWFSYRIEGGKVFGRLPYLLLESHPGNEAYFYNPESYNLMNSFEFVSDIWVGVRAVQHFDGFFLNRIPLIRKLKWREVAFFRGVWGSLSQENQEANALNHQDNGGPYYGSFNRGPYMEVGAGIENIFKVIRVDALWRLSYFDNQDAQKFSVRATLSFYF